ncbi:MAG: Dabb family protein [Chitinophagaceae bacterium]
MKLFLSIFLASVLTGIVNTKPSGQGNLKPARMNQSQSAAAVLRHVVLFKFKDGSTPAQVKEVENAFSALPGKIPTMIGYEWGTNISPENIAQGYTHCFLVTFKNAADRDGYLVHPAHKDFGKILSPYLDKVLVIDFIGQK